MLLFGDDYHIMPVDKNSAINDYDKRCCGAEQHATDKMPEAQLFAYQGDWLFTDIMIDQVFFLTKNFRVWCKIFKRLLECVRVGRATEEDADKMMKLHHVFYRVDKEFKHKVENHEKTMWLFSNNNDVRKKTWINLLRFQQITTSPLQGLNAGTTQIRNRVENRGVSTSRISIPTVTKAKLIYV